MHRVLILSPHTDDAEIGCGGTIVKLLETGCELMWVVFSSAEESLPEGLPRDELKREFLSVVKSLGLRKGNFKVYKFKVRHLHESRQIVLEELISIRKAMNPELVIAPSLNDYHQDHQVVAAEAVRAFKSTSAIIGYELPWNHITFDSIVFSRLKRRHILRKIEVLHNYQSQIIAYRQYFSKEYVMGLAKVRGIQCGSEYAEAFDVVRWIIP